MTALPDDIRTLDPARVGDTTSNSVASNIHDTPYEYHYLKRPLEIKTSMATALPRTGSAVHNGRTYETFEFSIRKGLRYADDVCFANGIGREITIDDIIFGIKRSADNAIDPYGFGILQGRIVGYDDYSRQLELAHKADDGKQDTNIKRAYDESISGVRKLDNYTLQVLLTESSPQIVYFFTMVSGSPQPRECVEYYNGQNGRPPYDRRVAASGPFIIKEWHSNYKIVLARNPNYRKDDFYPSEGQPDDRAEGLLDRAGKQLPLLDEVNMQIIKTVPPLWTLFDQGYLDRAGIPKEVYNQVVANQDLTPDYRARGVRLDIEVDVASYYWVFNFADPVLRNKKLRQALSLVLDRNEMLGRFLNGRGVVAHSIIPPGIEGYSESYRNPYSVVDLNRAKQLLAEAGYPGGIDPATKKPLKLLFTTVASPGSTSTYKFYADSFAQVNVELKVEQLDWPTVIQKKNKKDFQIIAGGWHADYPDPQNFLQLLYGPNSNNSFNEGNYHNPAYDALYVQMKNMRPGPERQRLIQSMLDILSEDAPIITQFFPITYGLSHKWFAPFRPHPTNLNQLKFRDLDPSEREELVRKWNRTPWTGYVLVIGVILAILIPGFLAYKSYSKRLS